MRLWSHDVGADGDLLAYGHFGRPLLVFPSERGNAFDYENRQMIAAIAELIDAGRLKVYCAGSFDQAKSCELARSIP